MAVHTEKITDKVAKALPAPSTGYLIYWCPRTDGFGVRVTSTGARAWVAERRLDGKTVRRTLGKITGAAAITADAARRLQIDISSELQNGKDRLEDRRAQAIEDKADALSVAEGVRIYVRDKRRRHGKDFLPLKERTKDDYLGMVAPSGHTKKGKPTQAGELHSIAHRAMHKLTAVEIQTLHKDLAERGERRQAYAMQLLRAVLRFHGINIEDNPLAPTTAGAKRIHIAMSEGDPTPIPAASLGKWWAAATELTGESADQLRAMLLVGARPGELPQLLARSVDMDGGHFTMIDTKNRSDHLVMMSTQVREIFTRRMKGKRSGDLVMPIQDLRRVLGKVNKVAGTDHITPHCLRHTFATVAEALVSNYVLKKMLNHATSGDVTAGHYVHIDQDRLRAGWQAVADFLDAQAEKTKPA
jgi:integrase